VRPRRSASHSRCHSVKVGDGIEFEVEDFVSPNTQQVVKITGIGFPNEWVSVAHATKSWFRAFGYDLSHEGKNAHASTFAWSA
jgi:hypothetical protein